MAEEEYPKTRNCSVPTPEEVVELIERLRSLENDLREKMETRSQNVRRVVSVAFRLIKSLEETQKTVAELREELRRPEIGRI